MQNPILLLSTRKNEPIKTNEMLEMFDEFDKDNSGTITWDELHDALVAKGVPIEVIEV